MLYPPNREVVDHKSRQLGLLKVSIDNLERAATNVRIQLRPLVDKDDGELKTIIFALTGHLAKLWYHFNAIVNEIEYEENMAAKE